MEILLLGNYKSDYLLSKKNELDEYKCQYKNAIWQKGDTMFYKKGVTDPDYCVLKFTATSGRYYCDLKTESFNIK